MLFNHVHDSLGLLVALLVLATSFSAGVTESVDSKGDRMGDGSSGAGVSSRVNTYTSRPRMSHRIMHFGKRHHIAVPSSLSWLPARPYDPYSLALMMRANKPIVENPHDSDRYAIDMGPVDNYDAHLLANSQQAYGPFLTSQRLQEQQQQQQQQDEQSNNEDQDLIQVHTRSLNRGIAFDLPREYVSTLYGPQAMDSSPRGIMNKKAVPRENVFMHFGRR